MKYCLCLRSRNALSKIVLATVVLLTLCGTNGKARSESATIRAEYYPPVPPKYFNDYAGVTTQTTQQLLNGKLAAFDKTTTDQVVVAIYKQKESSIPLDDYCTQTFNKWGVGQKGKNNGLVLLVFINDHLLRISTGRGLESVLPNKDCKRIIDEVIVPEFRKHNFDGGLTSGVAALLEAIDPKESPALPPS